MRRSIATPKVELPGESIIDCYAQAELGCFVPDRRGVAMQLSGKMHYALIGMLPAPCRASMQESFELGDLVFPPFSLGLSRGLTMQFRSLVGA